MKGVNEATSESQEKHDHETVGAVALDSRGNVACATSTGGITTKRPGRVGDSPIVGKQRISSLLSSFLHCRLLSCLLSCFFLSCDSCFILACPCALPVLYLRTMTLPVFSF